MEKTNTTQNIEGRKVKCSYCDYEWITMSKLKMVTCPSCLNKTEIEENEPKRD